MLKSSLCEHSDAYILVTRTITITKARADAAAQRADKRNKRVTLKNQVLFTNCIGQINNTQVDNMMPM